MQPPHPAPVRRDPMAPNCLEEQKASKQIFEAVSQTECVCRMQHAHLNTVRLSALEFISFLEA